MKMSITRTVEVIRGRQRINNKVRNIDRNLGIDVRIKLEAVQRSHGQLMRLAKLGRFTFLIFSK